MDTPTPHIGAKKGEIAKTVLMPGDPLRARFIAETFLEDVKKFNSVRNNDGFTGYYKGRKISVMGSGMGMASIGIYSYELFKFYDVENIVRVGSTGAYAKGLDTYDVILVEDAWSESTFAKIFNGYEHDVSYPTQALNQEILNIAKRFGKELKRGRVHSSDVFYHKYFEYFKEVRDGNGCIAVDMESFALFAVAQEAGKNSACLLTVSDNLETSEKLTSEERQRAFTDMMEIALELVVDE